MDTRQIRKTIRAYLIIAAVVLACDIISEFFSHGISSPFSRSAFAFPLIGGAAVYAAVLKFPQIKLGIWAYRLYNTGIACLTVGFSVKGALEVYGTSNSLLWVFFCAGVALIVAAGIAAKARR